MMTQLAQRPQHHRESLRQPQQPLTREHHTLQRQPLRSGERRVFSRALGMDGLGSNTYLGAEAAGVGKEAGM